MEETWELMFKVLLLAFFFGILLAFALGYLTPAGFDLAKYLK